MANFLSAFVFEGQGAGEDRSHPDPGTVSTSPKPLRRFPRRSTPAVKRLRQGEKHAISFPDAYIGE
jgi:hypothetical protein